MLFIWIEQLNNFCHNSTHKVNTINGWAHKVLTKIDSRISTNKNKDTTEVNTKRIKKVKDV